MANTVPGGSYSKESACNVGDLGSIPGLRRSPGGGHKNPFQCSCLENPHGQRSLVGYSPWGRKESDTTEQLSTAQHCAWQNNKMVYYYYTHCDAKIKLLFNVRALFHPREDSSGCSSRFQAQEGQHLYLPRSVLSSQSWQWAGTWWVLG